MMTVMEQELIINKGNLDKVDFRLEKSQSTTAALTEDTAGCRRRSQTTKCLHPAVHGD